MLLVVGEIPSNTHTTPVKKKLKRTEAQNTKMIAVIKKQAKDNI